MIGLARACVLALALAPLASCGEDDEPGTPAEELREAFAIEEELPISARFSVRGLRNGGRPIRYEGASVVDEERARLYARIVVPRLSAPPGPPTAEYLAIATSTRSRADAWATLPRYSTARSRPWFVVGETRDFLPKYGHGYVRELVDAGPERVEDRGTETVAGRAATHYRARFDLAAVAELEPNEGVERLRRLRAGPGAFVLDAWIAPGDPPVRYSVTLRFPAAAGRPARTIVHTVEVLDEPPRIPRARTADALPENRIGNETFGELLAYNGIEPYMLR